jgi:hypothetical protein
MELNSLAFGPIGKSFFQHMLMDSHLRFLSPLIVDGQSLPCVAHLAGSLASTTQHHGRSQHQSHRSCEYLFDI